MAAVPSALRPLFLLAAAATVAAVWLSTLGSSSRLIIETQTPAFTPSQIATTPMVAAPPAVPFAETPTVMPSAAAAAGEGQWEETTGFVEDMGRAAMPLAGAAGAVLVGLFFRRLMAGPSDRTTEVKPVAMAAEETPLARRSALSALAAVPMAAAFPALAAKTGGRLGGSGGFRSFSQQRASPPPPAASAPPSGNTTVFVTPAVPYGYGYAPASPFGFGLSTGQLLALSAIDLANAFAQEQRRQEILRQQLETQRQLGRDQAQIEALQQQLAAQDQRMRDLQNVMMQKGVPAPAQ
jgi:hypothetical protein